MVDDEFDDGSGPKVGDGEEKACPDRVYDPWHRAKPSSFSRFFNRSETPFLLIGASLIVLIIIFFLFVPRNGEDEVGRKLAFLEKRLAPLEDKLVRLEEILAKGSGAGDASARIEKQAAACDRAVDRFESVEASLTMRIDRIAQDVEKIKRDAAHIDRRAAESPKAPNPAAVVVEKKAPVSPKAASPAMVPAGKKTDETATAGVADGKGKPAHHEVRAGETLFRISRQYNMTVDELRRLNKLSEKDVISPGQKLVVTGKAK
jgi:LysM repeat protein